MNEKYIKEYEEMSLCDFTDELVEPLCIIKKDLTKAIYIRYAELRDKINMLEEDFEGTLEEYRAKKESDKQARIKSREERENIKEQKIKEIEEKRIKLEKEIKEAPKDKLEQYEIIKENNPMLDDYHTGIRSPKDIKTWDEVINDDDSFAWGDFTKEDAEKALKKGSITIYS